MHSAGSPAGDRLTSWISALSSSGHSKAHSWSSCSASSAGAASGSSSSGSSSVPEQGISEARRSHESQQLINNFLNKCSGRFPLKEPVFMFNNCVSGN